MQGYVGGLATKERLRLEVDMSETNVDIGNDVDLARRMVPNMPGK